MHEAVTLERAQGGGQGNTTETEIEPLPIDESFAVPASRAQLSRAAKGLTERGYTAHVVYTAAQARVLVRWLLPRDRSVFTAVSETMLISGIQADVDTAGDFRSGARPTSPT
ncbi:MAG TPA: hypothetical protein VH969_02120 [Actinophytocola sp.]|uniref:hypothetical protein n=1 Tax=Actinophytocola sp. TaxID=1872138 RepID=UPI002F95A29B